MSVQLRPVGQNQRKAKTITHCANASRFAESRISKNNRDTRIDFGSIFFTGGTVALAGRSAHHKHQVIDRVAVDVTRESRVNVAEVLSTGETRIDLEEKQVRIIRITQAIRAKHDMRVEGKVRMAIVVDVADFYRSDRIKRK